MAGRGLGPSPGRGPWVSELGRVSCAVLGPSLPQPSPQPVWPLGARGPLAQSPHLAKAQLTALTQDTSTVYSGWLAATVLAHPPHRGSAPHLVLGLCLLHLYAHSGSRFCVPGVTLSCHHVSKPDQLDPCMREGLYHQRIF